jgi:hypothetical protein
MALCWLQGTCRDWGVAQGYNTSLARMPEALGSIHGTTKNTKRTHL